MMDNVKSIFASKTFWLNLAGLVVALSGALPEKYAAIGLGIANLINRFFTTQPVGLLGSLPSTPLSHK